MRDRQKFWSKEKRQTEKRWIKKREAETNGNDKLKERESKKTDWHWKRKKNFKERTEGRKKKE